MNSSKETQSSSFLGKIKNFRDIVKKVTQSGDIEKKTAQIENFAKKLRDSDLIPKEYQDDFSRVVSGIEKGRKFVDSTVKNINDLF